MLAFFRKFVKTCKQVAIAVTFTFLGGLIGYVVAWICAGVTVTAGVAVGVAVGLAAAAGINWAHDWNSPCYT